MVKGIGIENLNHWSWCKHFKTCE